MEILGNEEYVRVQLLRKQYFQLLELPLLTFPPTEILIKPDIQANIYESMFNEENLQHPPPANYQIRVLKELLSRLENAITDPEEDEISDDLMSSLTTLLTSPQQSAIEAAQQKSYVTYSLPSTSSELLFNTVTSFESRGLLASSGTTGFRTWEAALHLATYLSSEEGRSVVKNKNVLELGAGTGVVSCLCAKHLRARHVLATDGDVSVVEDIKTNVFLNGLADTGRMEASVFKWGHALLDGTLSFHDETVQFNVVIGADITYDAQSIPSLVSTLRDLFAKYRDVEVIISAPLRNQKTFDTFLDACASNKFVVQEIKFDCPPIASQHGFFHSMNPTILMLSLKASPKTPPNQEQVNSFAICPWDDVQNRLPRPDNGHTWSDGPPKYDFTRVASPGDV